jgi:CheY-like chemotaxis protein
VPSLDTVEAGSDGDAPAAGTEPAARAPVAVAAAPAPRVLAVDDDPVAPLLLQAQFAAIGGWAIEVVDSPVRALEALRRAEPGPVRLVLLDLDLGAVRGESVLGALRAAGYTGPVVAYTGDGTPETAAALQAAGFEAVCLKPVNTGQLAELLRRFATPGKSS